MVNVFGSFNYRDSRNSGLILFLILLSSFTVLYWFLVNAPEHENIVQIYMWGVGIGFAFWVYDFIAERLNRKDLPRLMLGLGSDWKRTALVSAGAFVFGWFLVSSQLSIAVPNSIGISETTMRFLYVTIFSPIIEETLFRAIILGSLIVVFLELSKSVKQFKPFAVPLAVVVSSAIFAFFHFSVYGASLPLIINSFIFGLIASSLAYISKSILACYSVHVANNYFVTLLSGVLG